MPWFRLHGRGNATVSTVRNYFSRSLDVALNHIERDIEVDSFASLLRQCANAKALFDGERLHTRIIRSGYGRNVYLGNLIVQMYGKCGNLQSARNAFEAICQKNIYSWNLMLSAYGQAGRPREVLELYYQMLKEETVEPNAVTYPIVLSACAAVGELEKGEDIHGQIIIKGIQRTIFVECALVNLYAKCGKLEFARNEFDRIPQKNVVTWNAMITAYTQHGHFEQALDLYSRMDSEGVLPDSVTFSSILGACCSVEELTGVHSRITERGLQNVVVATALMNSYAKCGCLGDAERVFEGIQEKNVVSWNAMIAGFVQHGQSLQAIEMYKRMDLEGVPADNITFACIFGACSNVGALSVGLEIHSHIIKCGLAAASVTVKTALLNMHAKCGSIEDARAVFEDIEEKDLIAWNSMIGGYTQRGYSREAIKMYRRMISEGVQPDEITHTNALSACCTLEAFQVGKEIWSHCKDPQPLSLQNVALNLYAKCSTSMEEAKEMLEGMKERDVVSYNVVIVGYAQQGNANEAIRLFRKMEAEGIQADETTFASILGACSAVGDLGMGREIHKRIVDGNSRPGVVLETAMLSMYGKCGTLEDAKVVFNGMSVRNWVTWNAMLAACAQHGQVEDGMEVFWQMECEGWEADATSFVSLLIACSHGGKVEEGLKKFVSMIEDREVVLQVEHYRCMIDALGRAGFVSLAEDLLLNMPFEPDAVAWRTVLSACRIHSQLSNAARAAENALVLDPDSVAPYAMFSNMCNEGEDGHQEASARFFLPVQ